MRRFLTGAALGAAVVASLPAASGASPAVAAEPFTLFTNGTVLAVAAAGDRIYAGGDFTLIGAPTGSWVGIGPDGQPLPGRPPLAGAVTDAASDGRGGWFVAGRIAAVGSVGRSARIVHLRPNGALDSRWRVSVDGGAVLALARHGNTLFLGGSFKRVAGKSRRSLAAVSTTSGRLLPWRLRGSPQTIEKGKPVGTASITTLAAAGSSLYVAGPFGAIGGQRRAVLAAVAIGSGRLTRWNPAPNSEVNVIRPRGRTVYVGGYFSRVGGAGRNAVAAVDAVTGRSRSFNAHAPTDASVYDVAVGRDAVYVAGDFGSLGGKSRHLVAAVDPRTGVVTPWEPNVAGDNVFALELDARRNTLYIGGEIAEAGGQRRDALAALDTRSAAATAWDPPALGDITVMAVRPGGTVFVGGEIAFVGGSRRNGLASLTTRGVVTDWNPGLQGIVRAFAVNQSGSRLYVGGAFAPGDLPAQRNLAVVDTPTGALHSFGGGANSGVWAIAPSVDGATLYIGGAFVTVAGKRRTRLAALDPATGALLPWNSGTNDLVRVLRPANDALYVGGDFASAGGAPRPKLVKLDLETGAALGWDPEANDDVWALELRGETLYVGGSFQRIGGRTRNFLAALDVEGGSASSWDPNPDAPVRALRLADDGGRLYAGGAFGRVGSARRGYAEFSLPQGSLTSWNPAAFDGYAITFTAGGALVIGGDRGVDIFP
jgi:hypothetical protein